MVQEREKWRGYCGQGNKLSVSINREEYLY
jgi:hypothetical protein